MFCENCNTEIPDSSKFCLYCGNIVDESIPNETNNIEPIDIDNNDTSFSKHVLFVVVVVLIIAYFIGYENQNEHSVNKETEIKDNNSYSEAHNKAKSEALKKAYANAKADKESAWVFAQDAIKANLKSPLTAKFPWYDETYVTVLDDGEYLIKAYVDAENSYGAKIRNTFTVKIVITGEKSYTYSELYLQ